MWHMSAKIKFSITHSLLFYYFKNDKNSAFWGECCWGNCSFLFFFDTSCFTLGIKLSYPLFQPPKILPRGLFLPFFTHFWKVRRQTGVSLWRQSQGINSEPSAQRAAKRKLPLPESCCFLPSSYAYTTPKHNLSWDWYGSLDSWQHFLLLRFFYILFSCFCVFVHISECSK